LTPWEAWQEASRLRYRVERRRIDALVKASLKISEDAAAQLDMSKGYISVSGGKDSMVMLALVRQVYPDMPIIHFDLANRAMPGTRLHISEIEAHFSCRVQVCFVDQYHRQGMGDAWGDSITLRHEIDADLTFESFAAFNTRFGVEGAFVGLRADESTHRYYAGRKPILVYQSPPEFGVKWRVAPIVRWTTSSVWAYIIGNNLPIHPSYIDQINYGIDPDRARIASMALQRVGSYGATETAKNLWPDEMNLLREDNPDAHFE